jgi:hypothetical protein
MTQEPFPRKPAAYFGKRGVYIVHFRGLQAYRLYHDV